MKMSCSLERLHQLDPKVPWEHNLVLMERVNDLAVRAWYMQAVLQNGCSRAVLSLMIGICARTRGSLTIEVSQVYEASL